MASLSEIITRFAPISLSGMDGVKLQDRHDTKYVLALRELPSIMETMLDEYLLLEVDGQRGIAYRSLYFDTPDLRHYQDHHNQRTFRTKVRFREYVDSGLTFLEVKRKTGTGRTDKARIRVEGLHPVLSSDQKHFVVQASGRGEPLEASLLNHFTRFTFVHRTRAERITVDIGLRFSHASTERGLGDIAVAELKQERADRSSPFARTMRERNIRPSGMSKYCIGMLLLERPVKHNAFKEVLLKLERLREAA